MVLGAPTVRGAPLKYYLSLHKRAGNYSFKTHFTRHWINMTGPFLFFRFGRKKTVIVPMVLAALASMGAVLLTRNNDETGG